MNEMYRHTSAMVVIAAGVLLASGCAATPSATPTPDASASALSVVVIGDSIPFNSPEDCPGCTAFVDSYADGLAEKLRGRSYRGQ